MCRPRDAGTVIFRLVDHRDRHDTERGGSTGSLAATYPASRITRRRSDQDTYIPAPTRAIRIPREATSDPCTLGPTDLSSGLGDRAASTTASTIRTRSSRATSTADTVRARRLFPAGGTWTRARKPSSIVVSERTCSRRVVIRSLGWIKDYFLTGHHQRITPVKGDDLVKRSVCGRESMDTARGFRRLPITASSNARAARGRAGINIHLSATLRRGEGHPRIKFGGGCGGSDFTM